MLPVFSPARCLGPTITCRLPHDDMWKELPPDTLHARPETMRGLLDRIQERWGGVAGYVESIGIEDHELAQLRERSLE